MQHHFAPPQRLAWQRRTWLPYLVLAAFFVASVQLRPLVPTAETRYLSVAWEMGIKESYLLLTLNFAPYYHKPPLLFWLIAGAWELFGAYRSVATGVMFAIASATVYLSTRLAKAMFPDATGIEERIPWLMVGSAVFLIYSSLIYMDLLQTVFVLAFMLALLSFATHGSPWHAAVAGLCLGFGVLAKGPVMLLHVIWPVLLYAWWRPPNGLPIRPFYRGCVLIAAVALLPILAWLVPLIALAEPDFLYNLLWRQTVERVSGSLEGAHPQPFWFYFMFLPVIVMPWIFAPGISGNIRRLAASTPRDAEYRMFRLLVLWLAGVLLALSIVSGKQPHYLVPELPLVILAFAHLMGGVSLTRIRATTIGMVALFIVGQGIAAITEFDRLNLQPIASFMQSHKGKWAFAGGYQGEFSYLAKLDAPVDVIPRDGVAAWQIANPGGHIVMKTTASDDALPRVDFSQRANEGRYVVLHAPGAPDPDAHHSDGGIGHS